MSKISKSAGDQNATSPDEAHDIVPLVCHFLVLFSVYFNDRGEIPHLVCHALQFRTSKPIQ